MTELFLHKSIILSIVIVMVLIGKYFSVHCKSRSNPNTVLAFFFVMYLAIPVIASPDSFINSIVAIYMLLALICFCLPSLIFDWKYAKSVGNLKNYLWNNRRLDLLGFLLFVYIVIASFSSLIFVIQQGFSLVEIFSEPLTVATRIGSLRYSDSLTLSVYSILGGVLAYPIAFLSGLLFRLIKNREILYIIYGFLVPAFVMILQSSKGMFFLSAAFFYCGYLVARVSNGDYRFFPRLNFFSTFAILLAVVSLLWFSFISRVSDMTLNNQIGVIGNYVISYCCSHVYAFSDWLSDRYFGGGIFDYDQPVLSMGFYTFMPLFELVGLGREIPIGTYGEYFYDESFRPGNIYTVFRGLISDYSFLGSICSFFLFGFLANYSYFKMITKSIPIGAWVMYSVFFTAAYQSYAASTLSWSSTFVAFFIIYVTLKISVLRTS